MLISTLTISGVHVLGIGQVFMKGVHKSAPWNTNHACTIEVFILAYKTYYEAVGYSRDKVMVYNFDAFLKEGATTTYGVWK